jgi:four helix bundle protein
LGDNVILNKTYAFAKGIVVLCYKLQTQKKEYILSKQLLRSGTSVGANVEIALEGFQGRISGLKCQLLINSKGIKVLA